MIEAEWWDYDSAEELAEAVAGDIGFIIESALDARGSSLIALPGGDTAKPIYQALAAQKLPWKQVTIIPTDERLVPMDDARSNVRAIAQAFLPAGARVIPITGRHRRLSAGRKFGRRAAAGPAVAARSRLARHGRGRAHRVDRSPAPTFRMRSMRPRPGARSGVMPDPMPADAPVARVTLTRAAILSARTVLITVTGDEKREMLEQAHRGRAELEAADRPRAGRGRPADRHPLVRRDR